MSAPAWAWVALGLILSALLAADLRAGRRRPLGLRGAAVASGVWVAAAVAFGLVYGACAGGDLAGQYFAGYLLERSLSIDNVFVIALIFMALGVAPAHQRRVLFFGVAGALVLRAGFIIGGTALVGHFAWVLDVFAVGLLVAAWRLLRGHSFQLEHSRTLRLVRRWVPVDPEETGPGFVVRRGTKWTATPLLLALISVEVADLVFAADSIPAVFGVTRDTFVIFASNAFALLGMRALYVVLAEAMGRLAYLKQALVVLLGFVGTKMLADHWVHIPHWVTLLVIVAVLGLSVLASALRPPRSSGSGRAAVVPSSTTPALV